MRVGTHHEITTGQVTAFRNHLMTDAVANVVEPGATLCSEGTHGGVDLCGFQIGRRRVVIQNECGIAREFKRVRSHATDHLDGVGRTGIGDHGEIDISDDDLSGMHRFAPRVAGEYFFRDRQSHASILLLGCGHRTGDVRLVSAW